MFDFTDPIILSLFYLLGGTVFAYVGLRFLWRGIGDAGIFRGALLGLPVIGVAGAFVAMGFGGMSIALLCTASVLMLTLGLGVSAASTFSNDGISAPSLRLLMPPAACVFVIGFQGELTLAHALAIAVIAGLALWSAPRPIPAASRTTEAIIPLIIGIVITIGGAILVTRGAGIFMRGVSSIVVTPVVVLLVAPAMLLSLLGLLATEARRGGGSSAIDTVSGFVIACLGGSALVIVIAHLMRAVAVRTAATMLPSTQPTTAPSDVAALVIPMATWRVDSVLLVVLSALLIPVGTGHIRLGKVEGLALIGLYLLYASVATHTGAR